MSAYHPRVEGLPRTQDRNRVWASIGTETKRYEFLIVPETITYSYKNNFEKLPIAYTDAELIKYKNTSYSINIPNIKFWTRNSDRSLTEDLENLRSLVLPVENDAQELSFEYGGENISPVFIESFEFSESRRTGGNITQAEGRMRLLVGFELDSSEIERLDITNLDLTLRQRQQKAGEIESYFNNNPQKKEEFKVKDGIKFEVDGKGDVTQNGTKIGTVEEILN